ncbi:MAG: diguanylate cyclase [Pseudomonadales bacterium]|nr:diguanylate cyclase [Pseudomonadales bacterium]NRA18495.1 diguanylate cyclase [Oceanospirillaceae bacterium]
MSSKAAVYDDLQQFTTKNKKKSGFDTVVKNSTYYLSVLFGLTAVVIYFYLNALANTQVRDTAIKNAQVYLHALAEFRSLYTSEVVVKVKNHGTSHGIEITHDYKDKENAIPLPATLSMMLGSRLGGSESGVSSRLYSPYPFPWRVSDQGLNDDFSRQAWLALQADSSRSYYSFEVYKGKMSLRYARADIMQASCVGCHNSHTDTPKNDWKIGDVRGVLEIITPIDSDIGSVNSMIQHTLLLLILILFLALMGIRSVMKKLNVRSIEARQLAVQAAQINRKLELEVSYRKDAQQKLLEMSLTDGLTGVANRRKFDQELLAEWRRAKRDGTDLSLIMLDVDEFKAYNDNYGHQSGDEILSALAVAISDKVQRITDHFCRYGGEEFVLLLANTSSKEAQQLAEKVRLCVEQLALQHRYSETSKVVTISLGLATLKPAAGSCAEELIKAADVALYAAKDAGRNRLEVHQGD